MRFRGLVAAVALIVLAAAHAVAARFGVGAEGPSAFSVQQGSKLPSQMKPLGPPKDRTTARWAKMTPAQRFRGTLFREHRRSIKLLDNLLSVSLIYEPGLQPAQTFEEFLRTRACPQGVALEGRVLGFESFPVDDGSFLFTDFTIKIVNVFQQPAGPHLRREQEIVYGAPGGELEVEGEKITANANREPLLLVGRTYVFVAEYEPAFQEFHSTGATFEIDGAAAKLTIPTEFTFHLGADPRRTSVPADELRSLLSRMGTCK